MLSTAKTAAAAAAAAAAVAASKNAPVNGVLQMLLL